jgi:hypothetical protein
MNCRNPATLLYKSITTVWLKIARVFDLDPYLSVPQAKGPAGLTYVFGA